MRSDGSFVQVLAAGKYVIEVHCGGFESMSRQVTVKEGEFTQETFSLEKEPEMIEYHNAEEMKRDLMKAKESCPYAMHLKRLFVC